MIIMILNYFINMIYLYIVMEKWDRMIRGMKEKFIIQYKDLGYGIGRLLFY